MNKIKLLALALLGFFLYGCAETPDGTIVVNEETIENFFDRRDKKSWNPPSSLNLLINQPVAPALIPAPPRGEIRLYGTLNSKGPYKQGGKEKVSTFKDSVYGMLGPAGKGGNAWFYVDLNPATRQITNGRAYIYGFNGGVCDLRESNQGSWGTITDNGFTLTIDGYCEFPSVSGSMAAYALVIEGAANPLIKADNIDLQYIINDNGKFMSIPADPEKYPSICDYGSGTASVAR